MTQEPIRLTQYSHGAGCGCKIAPDVLDRILAGSLDRTRNQTFPELLVGNASRDDAAAVAIDDERAILSTTDFFMPIVDDPFDFGRIAATNAISDIYAMGGKPLVAIAILGWPIDKLSPEIAADVVAGGRAACQEAGIALAGGHSIDAPEPIFGLAVTGEVLRCHLKQNTGARVGDRLLLTKPLGIGVLTTAEKRQLLAEAHRGIATTTMCTLNRVGTALAKQAGVNAMTDVTGFGLAGHLLELCADHGLAATLQLDAIPTLPGVTDYIAKGCIPGGSERNFAAYGLNLPTMPEPTRALLCDPQTSGGLLLSVSPEAMNAVEQTLAAFDLPTHIIGEVVARQADQAIIQLIGD
ncbi:selenide, water dikinase [Luminiphilus syltensis NOR5-1B]|uniref:Selenide, water dikinase n=1 Tax=Luminiphilus syltensis NOR5-1B TaxID=565045 RepID=B8KYB4_9GAMM|nr:selenide, water dikinase SelD [Luminiphilus syltensis]EED36140.1 selenide, water dikinase [Luminiphilus syltensis NOR5-1B]